MRTPFLAAAFLGVFAFGCAGSLTDTGGGDDVQIPENCGNGVVDSGESCDDGNNASGDGCSAACATESSGTPRLNATVDKTTIMSELGQKHTVTVTLTSIDGFDGNVTLTPTIVDGAGAAITVLTATGPASVAVSADATATADYEITVPSDASGTALAANLKIDISSSAGPSVVMTAVNVAAIYTLTITAGTGNASAVHPGFPVNSTTAGVTIRRGTLLRMKNDDTVEHITHGGGGLPHEGTTVGVNGQPGNTYEVNTTAIAPGTGKTFGCHSHGGPNNESYAIINLL